MSRIHISTGDGQSSEHDEHEVLSMLQQGSLTRNAYFWKEGMSDWRPLADLYPAPVAPAYAPPPMAQLYQPGYAFTRDPQGLTKLLIVMMWVQLGVAMISMISDFAQLNLLQSGNITIEAAEANDSRQAMIGWVYIAMILATAVVFLMWTYRANLNCHGFGAEGMEFTPGWSVGWHFIPFMNLVRPYQVMREIWMVSADPGNWRSQKSGPLLGWWWALWLTSSFLGQVVFRMTMRADSPASLEAATYASIVAALVEIPVVIVAVTLISRIIRMQTKLANAHG